MKELICKECNNTFKTYKSTRLFCSRSCSSQYQRSERINVVCERIGCDNTFTVLTSSKRKRRFCSTGCQIEWQKVYQLGERNGNYGRQNKWGHHPPERRLDISRKIKESWKSPERLKKHLDFLDRHRLTDGSFDFQDKEFRNKISKANMERMINNVEHNVWAGCESGYYQSLKTNDNEYYQSSWELKAMKIFDSDDNVRYWTKKHKFIIEYMHNGYIKRYYPDFFIEYNSNLVNILEVKGYIKDVDVFKLKCEAALRYFKPLNIDYRIDFMLNSEKYSDLIDWFNVEKSKIYG